MEYAAAVDWLYATQFHGIKLGLGQVRRLFALLEIDSARPHFLHVAGTNGKGSICAMLDAICRADGRKTGLFTSPHLIHFHERIRVNGVAMPEAEIAAQLSRVKREVAHWENHPTFFEITTALALAHFQREKTEVVVLETGLGGRLDATNAVTPAVSVLAPIDLDHETWLGHTLPEIAFEKAGIIKPGVPVVSTPQHAECAAVIRARAQELGAELRFVAQAWTRSPVHLAGSHQRLNAAVAVQALEASGVSISAKSIAHGLAHVHWPGRFQRIGAALVIDGAHNPAAAQRLLQTWREEFGAEKATIIFAAMRDKEVRQILRVLLPIAAEFILAPLQNPRAASPSDLAPVLAEINPQMTMRSAESLPEALALAAATSQRGLITGSLFLAGEALAILEGADLPRSSAQ